jgi:sirohydrochlorin cobaltochelatase
VTRAIVLVAHGARDPRWAEPFDAVAARVRAALPGGRVALAFLELMAPTLAEAVDRLAAEGASAVDIVPLFLGSGGHVREHLPALVEALRRVHPGTALHLHPAIGEHTSVVEAMARAAVEAAGFRE